MTLEELERAWDLWFDLAQYTNDLDPPYTHGVFVGVSRATLLTVSAVEQPRDPITPDSITPDGSLRPNP